MTRTDRLLVRSVRKHTRLNDATIVNELECGHVVTLAIYTGQVICRQCGELPHSITNPAAYDALQELRLERWKARQHR